MTSSTITQITANSEAALPWHRLFSSLALAEQAAGEQTQKIAEDFEALDNKEMAKHYKGIAQEEFGHARLVNEICRHHIKPPQLTFDIYSGKRCRTNGLASLVERLALVHLVFEPSALGFLSYIKRRANIFFEPNWARDIEVAFSKILKEESHHVRDGRLLVQEMFALLSTIEQTAIRKSISTHKAFLFAGFKTFFCDSPEQRNRADDMAERYKFSFRHAVRGVIDGVA